MMIPVPNFDLTESSKKAAITAAISGAGSFILLGETDTFEIMGMSVPKAVIHGLTGMVGSYAADLSHTYVLPKLPMNANLTNIEVMGANAFAGGAVTGVAATVIPGFVPSENFWKIGLFGAASVLAGDVVYNATMNPTITADLF